ncbi:hypothetical protein [Salinibaculum rarum]|uniref:hypothetical protein n=1 Tax=Salinibaculum rarum TaxID=3058903 RepID=UPI00265DB6B9|nr:hypothetical protein [Salinibaculum sp. KK48]
MRETHLNDFEDVSSSPGDPGKPETSPALENLTRDAVSVPDRGIDWKDNVTRIADLLAVVEPAEKTTVKGISVEPATLGYVVGGLEAYRDEVGEKSIQPPSSFSEIESWAPHYVELTTSASGGGPGETWGMGITASRLKQAIVLATGEKSFRAADLTVTPCGKFGFIVEYHGDAVVAAPEMDVSAPESSLVTSEVAGIEITNEEDSGVLDGLRVVMPVLEEQFGIEITEFDHRDANALYFTTDQDKLIRLKGTHLKRATNPTRDVEALTGSSTYETVFTDEEHTYEVTEDDLSHTVGEYAFSSKEKVTLGYTLREKRIQRGLYPDKYGAGVHVLAQPWFLSANPDKHDDYISTRVYGSNCKDRVAEVEFDTPDTENPADVENPRLSI